MQHQGFSRADGAAAVVLEGPGATKGASTSVVNRIHDIRAGLHRAMLFNSHENFVRRVPA